MDAIGKGDLKKIANFGGNQQWYSDFYRPGSEAEILQILQQNPRATIRAIGSGHSWSDVAANAGIALDMSAFNSVDLVTVNGEQRVRVGAGCRLQDLLDRLHAISERTLPTLGAIKKQTISGAISTGTHGSGRQSLSHFVLAVRMAVFDSATGQPHIREFREGPELEAARCGLGCVGIILSVDLPTVPKYLVSETIRRRKDVEDIVAAFAEQPLSNFVLSPYAWTFAMFERKPVEMRRRTFGELCKAIFFRCYGFAVLDVGFHIGIHAARLLGPLAIKAFLRTAPIALIRNCERIDDAEHVLTSYHYLFRHEEMEIFVREADLGRAIRFVRAAIELFAGIEAGLPSEFLPAIEEAGLERALRDHRGSYTHHYPLFCRRILPDEAMISMTSSSDGPMYSISIFTYDAPGHRERYYDFCRFLAYSLLKLVNARLHWGKHFPFQYQDIASEYPRLEEFRTLCQSYDPKGNLRNGYTKQVLNLPPVAALSDSAHPIG
jgi:hypothetical protein